MGIPYSRQINAAFDQVTPLVAAGFRVLQTTKNISILLAVIQVLTVLFLALILVALVALLITVNPSLESERDAIVTPAVRWVAEMALRMGRGLAWLLWCALVGGMAGAGAGIWWTAKRSVDLGEEAEGDAEEREKEGEEAAAEMEGEGTEADAKSVASGKSK